MDLRAAKGITNLVHPNLNYLRKYSKASEYVTRYAYTVTSKVYSIATDPGKLRMQGVGIDFPQQFSTTSGNQRPASCGDSPHAVPGDLARDLCGNDSRIDILRDE